MTQETLIQDTRVQENWSRIPTVNVFWQECVGRQVKE